MALQTETMLIWESPPEGPSITRRRQLYDFLMNFSHGTTNAEYSDAAKRTSKAAEKAFRLPPFWGRQPLISPHLPPGGVSSVASPQVCGSCVSFCCCCCCCCFLASCAGSRLWPGLMNERGEQRLSSYVFLGLCACGLCGLSRSEEPCGDIFGRWADLSRGPHRIADRRRQ